MTNAPSPAAEQKAQEIAEAFMRTEFNEDAEAVAWLTQHIRIALEQTERDAIEKAMLSMRRDR